MLGKRSRIISAVLLCVMGIGLAAWMEKRGSELTEEGTLPRSPAGEEAREYALILSGDGMEEMAYTVSVEAAYLSAQEVQDCLARAKEEIDGSFFREGEGPDHASVCVYPLDTYADGIVSATWSFDDYDLITSQGILQEEKLREENLQEENQTTEYQVEEAGGNLIMAHAYLQCQGQEESYSFGFMAFPKERSQTELWLLELDQALRREGQKTGTGEYHLPDAIGGKRILWREADRHLVVKVIFFEILVLLLLYLSDKEKKQQAIAERKRLIQLDYSEIVSKLSILMGSGMALKMAWKRVAQGYEQDRERCGGVRPAYEEMLLTLHQMDAGESELSAYRKFGERTGVHSFLRLSRLLIQNQQKGSRDLCQVLEKESEQAFEERKLLARKQGEEAGTRMLAPLLLMMLVVIAVVIAPAIMKF